ncbi:DUF1592 domain-containing protein [Lignipirellula cremea]|nr:DUF1592 domain-containing protein [Lignipirellula cremea]
MRCSRRPFFRFRRVCLLLLPGVLALLLAPGLAVRNSRAAETAGDAAPLRHFLATRCYKCHGPEKQQGDFRLDTLADPGQSKAAADTWETVAEMIESGDMPPAKEPRPAADEAKQMVRLIADALARTAGPRPIALRRMNRREYENTVHDLLGVDTPLADLLPQDGNSQGFDNVADGLSISPILMERYLEAADTAFGDVIRKIKPLPPAVRRMEIMENDSNRDSVDKKKGGVIEVASSLVKFTPGWPPVRVDDIHPIEGGVYRCRIAVWPHDPSDRTLAMAVYVGPLFGPAVRDFMGIFDVTGTPENPRIIEFTAPMEEGESLHLVPWIYPNHVSWRDTHEPQPGVGVLWAESYGPLDQAWPSESQQKLFGDSPTITMEEGASIYMRHRKGVKLHHVVSSQPEADAERILRDFIPRAFRRPVSDAEAEPFVRFTLSRLAAGRSFEEAIRAGVSAVLCSPKFLLLNRESQIDDYSLASRMSYYLWSTMPDDELLQLAAAGKLSDPQVRHAQVERMLKDPRSQQFVSNFTGQWLSLRELEFTSPDPKLYPEFDTMLQVSMQQETEGFFRHLLQNNLSVMNFIDSDFAVLNERIARHYGIADVKGHEHFRVTPLPEDSIRGGVLTQASLLKVTANGTNSSPVIRGVWVLDHLLGQPAPPPPPGIPAVEPDIRGAQTIREQLDKHRSLESCARCHVRIDPPGFALECFDPIGSERTHYRSLGAGEAVRHKSYKIGLPVELDGVTADGKPFKDFREFRALLLQEREQVASAIAEKLLVYGTGRPLHAGDKAAIDAVVAAAAKEDLGLRSMVHAVVDSELFLTP